MAFCRECEIIPCRCFENTAPPGEPEETVEYEFVDPDAMGDGTITLQVPGASGPVDVMTFQRDGVVTVRGEIVDNNREVYDHFCEWLRHTRVGDGLQ